MAGARCFRRQTFVLALSITFLKIEQALKACVGRGRRRYHGECPGAHGRRSQHHNRCQRQRARRNGGKVTMPGIMLGAELSFRAAGVGATSSRNRAFWHKSHDLGVATTNSDGLEVPILPGLSDVQRVSHRHVAGPLPCVAGFHASPRFPERYRVGFIPCEFGSMADKRPWRVTWGQDLMPCSRLRCLSTASRPRLNP